MTTPATGADPRTRWVIAAAGAAVVVLGALLLVRAPRVAVSPRVTPELPPVKLSPGKPDELAMRDLAPLFLPTEYNAAALPLPPMEPGRGYFERDPGVHWHFNPDAAALALPQTVRVPSSPAALAAEPPSTVASGFGRSDVDVPALPVTGGRVDVYAGSGRNTVLEVALGSGALPAAARNGAWKPLEFVATIDASGLVGPLLLTTGSGVEEVDAHFRDYLSREFRIGDRLPPGFYRVVVGP